jgi:putative phage-type endonuclease
MVAENYILVDDDVVEMEEMMYEWIDEYLTDCSTIREMSAPYFQERMLEELTERLVDLLEDMGAIQSYDEDQDEVTEWVEQTIESYYEMGFAQPRSWPNAHIRAIQSEETKQDITKTIVKIRVAPQPEQRTREWYEFRHNLFSASNLHKIFGSPAQYNSLIYEKCSPLVEKSGSVSVDSPLHWGQKYEPVTILLYESMYGTRVADFGCIQHPTHAFIGASPDGINVDLNSERYGRMIEVKNVVNRELTGIPLEAYWIQMQIQMEVCGLDECDFIETQFLEYEDEAAFHADMEHEDKGVMLYFVERGALSNMPKYVYMPIYQPLDADSVGDWIAQKRVEYSQTHVLYKAIYWYLDAFSCVMVPRNREWFRTVAGDIERAWSTVLEERASGYEHRAPKKRSGSEDRTKTLPMGGICVIKLDAEDLVDTPLKDLTPTLH